MYLKFSGFGWYLSSPLAYRWHSWTSKISLSRSFETFSDRARQLASPQHRKGSLVRSNLKKKSNLHVANSVVIRDVYPGSWFLPICCHTLWPKYFLSVSKTNKKNKLHVATIFPYHNVMDSDIDFIKKMIIHVARHLNQCCGTGTGTGTWTVGTVT